MRPTPTEKRNVFLLAGAQALFQTTSVMVLTLSGLAGLQLASDKSWATLPIAMMMVAAAAAMIPASMFMQRYGRRAGFLVGAALGCLAGITAAAALWLHSFPLFVLGNMLVGAYQGFAQYYRFAAADVASADFKSRAISWVIAGGVVAAVAGPNIARVTQALGPAPFMVSYLALAALGVLALGVVARLDLTPVAEAAMATGLEASGTARPLSVIMRQPVFITALLGSAVGFAMMVMVMTATPLAMQMCGQPSGASTTVIQWHVLGMFLPSFFTGNLIRRFGVLHIMGAGIVLMAGHVAIALAGIEYLHFVSGLVLLGVGWNFLFIGGTNLLTQAYQASERAKTQAAHDFLMFGAMSVASFAAGGLLNTWGWQSVNYTVLPFLAITLAAVLGLGLTRKGGDSGN
jgi:MFS family permease